MRLPIILGTMAAGMAISMPAAAAVPLDCEPRSATHIAQHGGQAADSAWHVARGERPTCDRSDRHDDERKSRYCRRHWYC
jgi:hypothetical protein